MPQPPRLRVAVVARGVMPIHGVGGLERSVHDLVTHLAARDVDVVLVVPPPKPSPGAAPASDHPATLTSPRIRLVHVPYRTFPLANRRGTTVLDRSTAYLLYGWRAGGLARALAARGEVDVIHGFGASALGAARAPRPAPLVLNPQGLEEFGATSSIRSPLKRAGYAPLRWAVRRVARAADAVIATDAALESMVARHLRTRPGQLRTIPNGIDLAAADALAGPDDGARIRRRHDLGDAVVILSAGRLERNKGFDVLAEALGRAAASSGALDARGPWRWVIVGAGPFRTEIERAVHAHALDGHVLFAGRVSDADLHAWYEGATFFVHPTRYEGSSLVTLEAMAHRRAIVATRAGGLPDKVRPGDNGWLVDPEDARGLATAVLEAAANPAALVAMGTRSRAIVEREFSWTTLAERHVELYEELRRRK